MQKQNTVGFTVAIKISCSGYLIFAFIINLILYVIAECLSEVDKFCVENIEVPLFAVV